MKRCRQCGRVLDLSHDGPKRRLTRAFCDRACFGVYLATRAQATRLRHLAAIPRPEPRAPPFRRCVATRAELPTECPTCGCAWYENLGGVHCRNGHDLFIQAALDAVWAVP